MQLDGANAGCYIRPLRGLAAATAVYYDTTTYELSYLTSSENTKNNIQNLTYDTSVLYNLQPKTYNYNSDPDAGEQIGYIAEDAKTIQKLFATYDKQNDDPVAINYNVICVFLVEELKKLNKKVNDQQVLIETLLSKIQ